MVHNFTPPSGANALRLADRRNEFEVMRPPGVTPVPQASGPDAGLHGLCLRCETRSGQGEGKSRPSGWHRWWDLGMVMVAEPGEAAEAGQCYYRAETSAI